MYIYPLPRSHNTSLISAYFGLLEYTNVSESVLSSSSPSSTSAIQSTGCHLARSSPNEDLASNPASRLARIVTPLGLRASYTTFTETPSPLQNSWECIEYLFYLFTTRNFETAVKGLTWKIIIINHTHTNDLARIKYL
jgi:hypothetical protein